MTSCTTTPAPDICPTQDEIREQILALLPRGRAWQSPPGTVRWAFFDALAAVLAYANARICALADEFFCATRAETADVWMVQYGLPDACDPWPDLCANVAAVGGASCDYLQTVAASAGWRLSCASGGCGQRVGHALAGRAVTGRAPRPGTLTIRIDLARSPAYGRGMRAPSRTGRLRAGQALTCPPDVSPLVCIIERIAPAHAAIVYEVIE